MYAWRALGLKEGRNGTRGAGDFEVKVSFNSLFCLPEIFELMYMSLGRGV